MRNVNVLFTSAGRRVALIQTFRRSLAKLGFSGKLITADAGADVAARYSADCHEIVPRVDAPEYIPNLLEICKTHDIRLIVPLIDPELHVLSQHQSVFADRDIVPLISSQEVTKIAFDKRDTERFFRKIGVATPRILGDAAAEMLPAFLKPARGSGSVGAMTIRTASELETFQELVPDAIVQELVAGSEYTIDVLADANGKCRSIVPRRRLETRAGEVSKGVTAKIPALMNAAEFVVNSLPGAFGPITLQCFMKEDGNIVFIEINPRFGGGFPLSYAAGADFPGWILQWIVGEDPTIGIDDWQDGLMMLRYDDAFFVTSEERR